MFILKDVSYDQSKVLVSAEIKGRQSYEEDGIWKY